MEGKEWQEMRRGRDGEITCFWVVVGVWIESKHDGGLVGRCDMV